jgi:glycosyltransferase involved in cell wall biosynthesis
MNQVKLSVVIPTYNRQEILKKCISSVLHQTYSANNYEIIIINDQSSDETELILKVVIKQFPDRIKYFSQHKKGPAAARNLGIKEARGDIILLLGDDMIPAHTLIEEHVKVHAKFNHCDKIIVLGYIVWPSFIENNRFIQFLDDHEIQFSYKEIEKHEECVSWCDFYSSNISLSKKLITDTGLFDEEFPYAAFEDTELGYRLHKNGAKIIFNKNAVVSHWHSMNLKTYSSRMRIVGRSSHIISKKIPNSVTNFQIIKRLKDVGIIRFKKIPIPINRLTIPLIFKTIPFIEWFLSRYAYPKLEELYLKILYYHESLGRKEGDKII